MDPLVSRLRRARQANLLWMLTIAVERKLPVAPMLDALADDASGKRGEKSRPKSGEIVRSSPDWVVLARWVFTVPIIGIWMLITEVIGSRWRYRLRLCSQLVSSGVPLVEALEKVGKLLDRETLLTLRVADESGVLDQALRSEAVTLTNAQDRADSSAVNTLVYLYVLLTVLVSVSGFLMFFIIPKFKRIFDDFGAELPAMTRLVIDIGDSVAEWYWLFLLLIFAIVVSFFIYLTNEFSGPFGWIKRLVPRARGPAVLRSLAVVVSAGRPIVGALSTLARHHPDRRTQERLRQARGDVEDGMADSWMALTNCGLITANDANVLESAQRAGNLPWALRETAERISIRLSHRLNLFIEWLSPLSLLIVGAAIGFFAIGMFLPLVKLINDLS